TKAEGIMFSLVDRRQQEVGLGPTHEEVITAVARDMIRSYRQLPLHLYQIQTKFRDEIRPRFGLLRGREFIMKDGYSFHTDETSLKATYQEMYTAYSNILRRCGLEFRAVDADSGAIGGSGSTEFMVLAEAGEDEVLYTEDGKYAANVEKAVSRPAEAVPSKFEKFEKLDTPNTPTIESLAKFLKCSPTQIVKNVLYQATFDNSRVLLVIVSLRGDQDVNEVKLTNELSKLAADYGGTAVLSLEVPNEEAQRQWVAKPLPLGYMAPNLEDDYINGVKITDGKDIEPKFLRLVDRTATELKNFVTGSNESGYHTVGGSWDKEFTLPKQVVDVRKAAAGDRALHDPSQTLQTARGIEIGHIFQLGTKYSQALGATYTSETGAELPLMMGCYGVGVSRLAQAAVEQSYDKHGIVWPVAIAPYQAIVVIPNMGDDLQVEAAKAIYKELLSVGVEALLDDRDERAGVKFKDADLIGIPYRIVTGRALGDGKVEVVERATGIVQEVTLAEVVAVVKGWIDEELLASR
ncbi:MAG: proline--tRNA ligase, partial [Nodosilinea sp.]